MSFHGDILEDCGIHIINAWSYANATDRGTHTPSDGPTAALDASDIGRVSHQTDDDTFWVLTGVGPITWRELTNPTGSAATLQTVYVAGNTITTSAPEGDVDISGTEDLLVTVSDVDIDVSGSITLDATTSITIGGDVDTSSIDIGTSASARDIAVGNNTGATGIVLTAGTDHTTTTTGIAWTGEIHPTTLVADEDDYNPTGLSTAALLHQDASVDVAISGIVGGVGGRLLVFHNISTTNQITLASENIGSVAANRFVFSGSDVILPIGGSTLLLYDSTISRWRPVGSSPGVTGGRAWSHNVFTSSSGTPYIRTTTSSYENIGTLGWPGADFAGNPTAILSTIRLSGGASMNIRIYDVTNAAVIAAVTGFTTTTFVVYDLGTLSNVTTTAAIWEIQLLASGGGGKADCAGLTIRY